MTGCAAFSAVTYVIAEIYAFLDTITPGESCFAAVAVGADFALLAFVAAGPTIGRADREVKASFGRFAPGLAWRTTVTCGASLTCFTGVAAFAAVLGIFVEVFALFQVGAPGVVVGTALSQTANLTRLAGFTTTTAVFGVAFCVDASIGAPTLALGTTVTFCTDLGILASSAASSTVLGVLAYIHTLYAATFAVLTETDSFLIDTLLAVNVAVAVVVNAITNFGCTEAAGAVVGVFRLLHRELSGWISQVQVHVHQTTRAFFAEAVVARYLHDLAAVAKLAVEAGGDQVQTKLQLFNLRSSGYFEEKVPNCTSCGGFAVGLWRGFDGSITLDRHHREHLTFFGVGAIATAFPQGDKAASLFTGVSFVVLEQVEQRFVVWVFDQDTVGIGALLINPRDGVAGSG